MKFQIWLKNKIDTCCSEITIVFFQITQNKLKCLNGLELDSVKK